MKSICPLLHPGSLLIIGCIAYPLTATAATLFSENFESYTAGSTLGTNAKWGTATNTASMRTVRNESTATPFGTPNKYAEFNDASATNFIRFQSVALSTVANAVTTLTLDFFEPGTGGSSSMGIGYALSTGDLNGAGSRARVTLNDGIVGGVTGGSNNTYLRDNFYTLTMIFNDTNAAVAYAGGTVGAYSAHVWLRPNGGLASFAGSLAATNSTDTAYTLGFRTFSADTQSLLVDNVLVETGAAAIPEPSAALMGMLAAGVLIRRRR